MKKLVAFITVVMFSFPCEMSSDAELESDLFESHHFNFLNVKRVQTRLVNSHIHCSFACLQNALCFSFNAAVSADGEGKFICELLSSSLYKDEGNQLLANEKFHHYSSLTKNPCSSEPCLNNGTCSPISLRDGTYKCTCHPGYLGNRCEIAAPECYHYNILSEPNRHHSFRRGQNSDQNLVPGWYRFKSSSYSRMINSCVPYHRCSTDITGWLNGIHPSFEDGIVTREVCFHGYDKCCYRKVQIRVRECKGFYVYKLLPSPSGLFRYCAKA